jgi:8-oxo-dGTP diphosphatase
MTFTPIFSVVAYIERADGAILCVSRKNDHESFGLVGGKIDPGESPEAAIRREAREETGIELGELSLIFDGPDAPNQGGKRCLCYRVLTWSGTPGDREGAITRWLPPEVLVSQRSTFSFFNRCLFEGIGKKV